MPLLLRLDFFKANTGILYALGMVLGARHMHVRGKRRLRNRLVVDVSESVSGRLLNSSDTHDQS